MKKLILLTLLAAINIGATVHCDGNGVRPPFQVVEPTELHFGDVEIGTSDTLGFVIRNDGGGILRGTVAPDAGCGPHYSVTNLDEVSEYEIAAGDSILVWVQFQPLDEGLKECDIDAEEEMVP